MTWLESINGGRPLQVEDWAVLTYYLVTYTAILVGVTYLWRKTRELQRTDEE